MRFLGKIQKLGVMNAITDRLPNSRKSNFATAPTNVTDARARLAQLLAAAGAPPEAVEEAAHLCDAHTLTLGFSRRFATSKRPRSEERRVGKECRSRWSPYH